MIKVHQHALINQMLYQQKEMQPNDVLVQPTEKVSCKRATSGKNESRALLLVTVKDDTVILQLHH